MGAYGASVQAGTLYGCEDGGDLLLLDVTPLTLGFESGAGEIAPMIMRNTVIPTKRSQLISTSEDNQQTVSIRIYEGERPLANDSHFLGEFNITGIPPAPRGQPRIEVTFEIDSNGILYVGAEHRGTGKSEKVSISNDKGRLTEEQIEHMIRDAERFASVDQTGKERRWARTAFSEYLGMMKGAMGGSSGIENVTSKMDDKEKEMLLNAVNHATQWLRSHPGAELHEIEAQRGGVESMCKCTSTLLKYCPGDAARELDVGNAPRMHYVNDHKSKAPAMPNMIEAPEMPKMLTDVLFDSIDEEL